MLPLLLSVVLPSIGSSVGVGLDHVAKLLRILNSVLFGEHVSLSRRNPRNPNTANRVSRPRLTCDMQGTEESVSKGSTALGSPPHGTVVGLTALSFFALGLGRPGFWKIQGSPFLRSLVFKSGSLVSTTRAALKKLHSGQPTIQKYSTCFLNDVPCQHQQIKKYGIFQHFKISDYQGVLIQGDLALTPGRLQDVKLSYFEILNFQMKMCRRLVPRRDRPRIQCDLRHVECYTFECLTFSI